MPIRHGKVVARIVTIRGDGSDPDSLPDVVGDATVRPRFSPVLSSFVSSELGAIVTPRPVECTVDASGVMRDEQGIDGVWLLAGTYKVSGVPLVNQIVVTEAHTDAAPLDLRSAVDFTAPPGTPVQTVVVPAGASDGQVLAWAGGLTWVDAAEGGDVDPAAIEAAVQDYLTANPVPEPDLSGYATTAALEDKADVGHTHPDCLTAADLPAPPDLSWYALTSHEHPEYVNPDLSGYATTTALAGKADADHTHPEYLTADDLPEPAPVNYATIPAGSVLAVYWTGTAWPSRPTARTDVTVDWTDHTGTSTTPAAAIAGVDRYTVVDTP